MQFNLLNIHLIAGKEPHCISFSREISCCLLVITVYLLLLTFELSNINSKCSVNCNMLTIYTNDSTGS